MEVYEVAIVRRQYYRGRQIEAVTYISQHLFEVEGAADVVTLDYLVLYHFVVF